MPSRAAWGKTSLTSLSLSKKKIRLCHKPKIFHAFFEHRRRFAAAFYEMRHQECLLWKLMLENNRSVAVNNSFCLSLSLFSSQVDNLWVAFLFASDGRDWAHKSVIQCEVKGSPPSGGLGSWYTFRVLGIIAKRHGGRIDDSLLGFTDCGLTKLRLAMQVPLTSLLITPSFF